MANLYKNEKVDLTSTDATVVYTAPLQSASISNSATAVIKSIIVSEDSNNADTLTLTITNSSGAVFSLFKDQAVTAKQTLELLSQPLVLNSGDILKATAGTADRLHVIVSLLEIS